MLPSTRKISIIVAMIALPLCTFAISKKEAAKLEAISKEMYERGNEQYIYVDFYKDGLLKDGEDYTMTLDSNSIVLNGKQLPEPYHTTYKQKRAQFNTDLQLYTVGTARAIGKLQVKHIYDKKSCFRKSIGPKPMTAVLKVFQTMAVEAVLDDMKKDGVLKDATKFHFQWKRNTIRINGEKLPKDVAKKYIVRLEKIEGLLTGNSFGFTQNMNQ
ncbi:MAG TPA: hypothetical protein VK167_13060 [Flavipsychrobacter sp.]|nr:hypothetical protein [Flavipsychrobacter sp.]